MPHAKPLLTIGIATFERVEPLRRKLGELAEVLPPDVEVLVIDNASRDGTAAMLGELGREHRWLRHGANPVNLGCDVNYLRVIEQARGTYCWLLGDDAPIDWRHLAGLVDRLRTETRGVVHLAGSGVVLPAGAPRAFTDLASFVTGFYSLVRFQELSSVILRTADAWEHLKDAYALVGHLHAYTRVATGVLGAGRGLVIYELPLLGEPPPSSGPRWGRVRGFVGAWLTMRASVPPPLRPPVDRREAKSRMRRIARFAKADLRGWSDGGLQWEELRAVAAACPLRWKRHLLPVVAAWASGFFPRLGALLMVSTAWLTRGSEGIAQLRSEAGIPDGMGTQAFLAEALRRRHVKVLAPTDGY